MCSDYWAAPPRAAYANAQRIIAAVPGGRSLLANCGGDQPDLELKLSALVAVGNHLESIWGSRARFLAIVQRAGFKLPVTSTVKITINFMIEIRVMKARGGGCCDSATVPNQKNWDL